MDEGPDAVNDPPVPDPLRRIAERQHGLVTRTQARTVAGRTHRSTRLLEEGDGWGAVTDEVVRAAGAPRGRGQRVMAAVLDGGPGSVLGFASGAHWWGVRGAPLHPLHIVRVSRSRRSTDLAVVHTVRRLPADLTCELDGIPIGRPELIALQLFASQPPARAERWVDAMWSMRLLDGRSVERLLAELGARGRNGTAGLRGYLDDRGPGYVPPASGLESRAMQVFRDACIPMERQVDTGDDRRWTGRVDFRHRWLPVVVEVQSERHHAALVDRRADDVRLAALAAAGFTVVEVTDVEVWTRPDVIVERTATALRSASVLRK